MSNPNSKEISGLKKKQKSISARLTVFERFIKKFVRESDTESGLNRDMIIQLDQRIQDIHPLILEFNTIQDQIEGPFGGV